MIKKLYTTFLILYPILNLYEGFLGLSLSMAILVPILLLGLIFYKGRNQETDKTIIIPLIIYLFVIITTTLISLLIGSDFNITTIIFRIILFVFFIMLVYTTKYLFDINYGFKLIIFSSLLFSILLWIQISFFYIFGNVIQFYLPFFKLTSEQAEFIIISIGNISIYRPKSVFLEPSQFAFFTSYGLTVLLFVKSKITNYYKFLIALFLTVSLFASTAGTGFVLACIIWFYYLAKIYYEKNSRKIPIIIFTLLIISAILLSNDYFTYSIGRLTISQSRVTSFIGYFNHLNVWFKFTGVGIGNYINYIESNLLVNNITTFISGIGFIFIENGYIGFLLFSIISFNLYLKTSRNYKVFIALFFLTNIFAVTIYNIYFVLYLIWPVIINKSTSRIN